jgi:hypothetical protein
MRPSRPDWNAVLARLEFIADTLELPYSEVTTAAASEEALVEFADRHNQSLEWILLGNLAVMISELRSLKQAADELRDRNA